MKYLVLIVFLFSLESVAFSKPPKPAPTAAPVATPSSTPKEVALPLEGAWANKTWDVNLYAHLQRTGMQSVKSIADAKMFCPKYSSLSETQRLHFWQTLMIAMAKRESSYKTTTTYSESFKDSKGKPVISTGLFQISQESTRQKVYNCPDVTTESLKDPFKNIECSVNILSYWVKKDGYAAGRSGTNSGCGRYWSVCRPGSSQTYIASQTTALSFCK